MYSFLAALAAVLIAVMVAINGRLTAGLGISVATVVIFIVGTVSISLAALIKRERVFAVRGLPLWLFSGGVIGYFTTLFNNMSVGRISITAILALSLLGQAATSLVIDQFGFFDMPARRFNAAKLLGLAATGAGIAVLLSGGTEFAAVPVIVSFLSGVTVVTSRHLNAQLAEKTSVTVSTWYNYALGILCALAALAIALLTGDAPMEAITPDSRLWVYTGGAIGVAVVFISNIVTMKMPALIMTLIMFAGQVFGGVAIDAAFYGDFSWKSLVGGACAFLGLVVNVMLDKKQDRKGSSQ